MENIIESLTRTATTTTTTAAATATRRLRSLYLPSSDHTTELTRRFNSLRRSANHKSSTSTTEHKKIRIKLIPNITINTRCFVFDVVDYELESEGPILKLGRYSDRTVVPDRISFKSKVVSRYHAEIWLSKLDNKVMFKIIYILMIYIRDTGSSSGTFVNHIRLSAANTESATPYELVDGDLIQLGMDYKGGIEPVFRAVKMRLEVDRKEWYKPNSNAFRLTAFQQLREKMKSTPDDTEGAVSKINNATAVNTEDIHECCICLYCIAPFQALFIAPCSHIYHYKCIRPLLVQNYPGFSCPLCRTYSNLEASVAVEENEVLQMLGIVNIEKDARKGNIQMSASEDKQLLAHKGYCYHREKTLIAEEEQESPSNPLLESSSTSLFFQLQIPFIDSGLEVTSLTGTASQHHNAGESL
ncbi:uncharacterized protein BX663DRAFT_487664 [Cokeromyces recurvatus]|uniref:uncharacterized protein n=1 Tax=Cokeromyces recurvatus TaxID=90255 RepID=UPI00222035F6|nr:uncharacterized protein BX663DRAFT_487664 [Cokeromyces recurvatus]KAI7901522.1 hypothetical protein BX663DRAFT_487664 [Cokeromyces recurvatus]